MLTPDAATRRLEEFKVPRTERRSLARARALREPHRTAALALLGFGPDGQAIEGGWQPVQDAQQQAIRTLTELGPDGRLLVWQALFPAVAPHVEGAWTLQMRLSYQSGYERRAFRAPGCEAAYAGVRLQWLTNLHRLLEEYEQPVTWIAAWAPYIQNYLPALGPLLAAAIDDGGREGEEVFETLLASGRGEHEIGGMGRHVVGGLLCASRPDGWEFVEKLLLAAQRQEGLRQAVLEAVDETHPEAFRRMLRLIVEDDLLRFSAAARAIDVWYGLQLDALTPAAVRKVATQALEFVENPAARGDALVGGDPQALYLAFCTAASEDALPAIAAAAAVLPDPNVEQRYVAAAFLRQAGLPESRQALLPVLEDADLRIAFTALDAFAPQAYYGRLLAELPPDLFERLEALLARSPKETKLPAIVWPWAVVSADRQRVAGALVAALGDRSPKRLIPHLRAMDSWKRKEAAEKLAALEGHDAEVRETLFVLAGDAGEAVREPALQALAKLTISPSEEEGLEALLTRKSGDLRRGVLSLLLSQPDEAVLGAADRLLSRSNPEQRLGGLELLQQLSQRGRAADAARSRAAAYRAARPEVGDAEQTLLAAFEDSAPEAATLDDALGLLDPAQRTPVAPLEPVRGIVVESPAAVEVLRSLDVLIHEQRERVVRVPGWNPEEPELGARDELLGNLQYGLPRAQPGLPPEKDLPRLPAREVWEAWLRERPAATRDRDGFELLRALVLKAHGANEKSYRYQIILAGLLPWLVRLHSPPGAPDFLLDAAHNALAAVPAAAVLEKPKNYWDRGWRGEPKYEAWLGLCRTHRAFHPHEWTAAQVARLWGLLRWWDEPVVEEKEAGLAGLLGKKRELVRGTGRYRPELDDLLAAWETGAATDADVYDQLLGPVNETGPFGRADYLRMLSTRKPPPSFAQHPRLAEVVERCRQRVIEVELRRGDIPTAATPAALALRFAGGLETLVRLLQALGKGSFVRGWIYSDRSKGAVYSHLIRSTHPATGETPELFAHRVKEARIPEKRLIELAFYAPQWATHVEAAVGWPELAGAAWWVHAHTKDENWRVDAEIRESWTAQMSERTPLTAENLVDGGVDVAWFHRLYTALGPERWSVVIDEGAKYASGGGGHKRAQLFADAMLGRADRDELAARVREKRHGDSLRALGLFPLPAPPAARDAEVLARYEVAREFVRTSRQFGAMRQASEKLAAGVSLENLARTAGYPDPVRLEWAMEARAIKDLAAGPITASHGGVEVSLSVNAWGAPEVAVRKDAKPLKSVPPAAKKDPAVAALLARKTEVERQSSRMRASLEAAICRGDAFTPAELEALSAHPVLAPMLRNLVFLTESGGETLCMGYPVDEGRALESHDASVRAVHQVHNVHPNQPTTLRLAHPYDLFRSGEWDRWQHDCFRRERIQPFKQVFRELYLLTDAEQQEDGRKSVRYTGHQVHPNQARALLGKRGWVSNQEEGDIRRTFHSEGLTAWLLIDSGITTPGEVEGLTIDCVGFSRRGEREAVPLTEIPPRLFSEVMRDVDLVVSVAHVGGVDPEATQSTIEMRAALLRETLGLLKIGNVRLNGVHAFVEGKLGSYNVHLGSAVVHRQPGGHLCIVPVHSQHCGRLFLPFADNDPRTAEVVSKVLLLAKDQEIKDPTILEQIMAS